MAVEAVDVKKLREITGAGVLECKQALEESSGDFGKATDVLKKKGFAKAAKKLARSTNEGRIGAYIHTNGKIGALVEINCETDFVAKTDTFKNLCHEIALQVCVEEYTDVDQVLNSEYIRIPEKKIKDLISETSAKVGEKIELKKFVRFSVL